MMNSLEHRPLKLSALSPWVPEPYKFAPIEIEPVESPCPRSIQIWSWRPIDLLELRWVKIPVVSFFALALATRLTASRFTDFGRSNLSLISFSFLSFFMLSEKEVLFSRSWFISVDLFKVNFLWILWISMQYASSHHQMDKPFSNGVFRYVRLWERTDWRDSKIL